MNKHPYIILAAFVLLLSQAAPLRAETGKSADREDKPENSRLEAQENRLENAKKIGDKEIAKRLEKLEKLRSRITEIKNLSVTQRESVIGVLDAVVKHLTDLDAALEAATSTATTKAIRDSIAQDYRIYALMVPQYNVIASADRVITIGDMLLATIGKFETRLAAAASSTDVTAQRAALEGAKAKVNTAKTEAQAALDLISALTPDLGDKTVFATNNTALKAARAKIKDAHTSLFAARKELGNMLKEFVTETKRISAEVKKEIKDDIKTEKEESDRDGN